MKRNVHGSKEVQVGAAAVSSATSLSRTPFDGGMTKRVDLVDSLTPAVASPSRAAPESTTQTPQSASGSSHSPIGTVPSVVADPLPWAGMRLTEGAISNPKDTDVATTTAFPTAEASPGKFAGASAHLHTRKSDQTFAPQPTQLTPSQTETSSKAKLPTGKAKSVRAPVIDLSQLDNEPAIEDVMQHADYHRSRMTAPPARSLPVIKPEDIRPFESQTGDTSISSLVKAVRVRYQAIIWDDTAAEEPKRRNVISLGYPVLWGGTRNAPGPLTPAFFTAIDQRIKANPFRPGVCDGVIRTLDRGVSLRGSVVQTFKRRTEWWSTEFISDFCQAIANNVKRVRPQVTDRCRILELLLPWEWSGGRWVPKTWGPGQLPWPALGRDASWRNFISVGVINVAYQSHFVAVAIFGPARLVIPFDGFAGASDDPEMSRVR